MADTILCKKDYLMENGWPAFLAGKEYQWRWTTEEEQDETGREVALTGELGPDHYLGIIDIIEHFEGEK